jgi:hypothetical protein
MDVIEVTDPIEARRARIAQFQARASTMDIAGYTVYGIVQSVMKVANRQAWEVRISLKEDRYQRGATRFNPHIQQFTNIP